MKPVLALTMALAACGSSTKRSSAPVETGDPMPYNQPVPGLWWDAVGERWWLVGSRLVDFDDAKDACGQAWTMPTVDMLRVVRARGICTGDGCPAVWATDLKGSRGALLDLTTGEIKSEVKNDTVGVAYCAQPK